MFQGVILKEEQREKRRENMNLGKLQEMARNREAWFAAVHGVKRVGHNWATEQQQQQQEGQISRKHDQSIQAF